MLYLLIALGASLVGAVSGLGGGVIIKPMLDLVSSYSVSNIGVLSAFTVMAMSTASLAKHILLKTPIAYKLGTLFAAGSFIGGYLGDFCFNALLRWLNSAQAVTLIQNTLLITALGCVLIYMLCLRGKRSFHVSHSGAIILCGVALGTLSTFLGIGGGPINVVVLVFLFSMELKQATVNSLLLIFFSQLSKLTTIWLSTGFALYDLTAMWVMLPGAVVGGIIGAQLNKKLTVTAVNYFFNLTVVCVMLISACNVLIALRGAMG